MNEIYIIGKVLKNKKYVPSWILAYTSGTSVSGGFVFVLLKIHNNSTS